MSLFETTQEKATVSDRHDIGEQRRDIQRGLLTRDDFQNSNLAKDENGNVLAVKDKFGKLLFTASYDDNNNLTNLTYLGGHSIQRQLDGSYLMKYNNRMDSEVPEFRVTEVKVLKDGKISWKSGDTLVLIDNVNKKLWQNGKLQEEDSSGRSELNFNSPFDKSDTREKGWWDRLWESTQMRTLVASPSGELWSVGPGGNLRLERKRP